MGTDKNLFKAKLDHLPVVSFWVEDLTSLSFCPFFNNIGLIGTLQGDMAKAPWPIAGGCYFSCTPTFSFWYTCSLHEHKVNFVLQLPFCARVL